MSEVPHWFRTQWALCLLRVVYTAKYRLARSQTKGRRDHWSFITVHEGRLRVSSFTFDTTVNAGQTVVLPPYRHAEYRSIDARRPILATEIGFDVEAFLRSGNPLTRLGFPVAVTLPRDTEAREWCTRMESFFGDTGPISDIAALYARSWFDLLLLMYVESGFNADAFDVAVRNPVPAWVQAMADRIAKNSPSRQLRPHALHRLVGFSRSHVNAAFKKYLGETPRRYLHRRRIQLAMQRLTGNPETSLSEVAASCGYSTQALFNRHFRKLTGMTPGKFRRTHAGDSRRRDRRHEGRMETHGQ